MDMGGDHRANGIKEAKDKINNVIAAA